MTEMFSKSLKIDVWFAWSPSELQEEASLQEKDSKTLSSDLIEYVQHMIREHKDNYKVTVQTETVAGNDKFSSYSELLNFGSVTVCFTTRLYFLLLLPKRLVSKLSATWAKMVKLREPEGHNLTS